MFSHWWKWLRSSLVLCVFTDRTSDQLFFSPFGHRTAIGKLAVLPYVARIRCAVDKRALCHHRVTYLHTALSCMTFHAVVVQKTEQGAMQSSGCYEVLDSRSYKMLEAMQNFSNTRCYQSLHFDKRTCLLEGLLSQVRWLKRRSFHCFQIPSSPWFNTARTKLN